MKSNAGLSGVRPRTAQQRPRRRNFGRSSPSIVIVFGADRSQLLRSVAQEAPQFVLQARDQNRLAGYAFGRQGSIADHMGPWVAQDEETARILLQEFLQRSRRSLVFLDAMKSNPWGIARLRHQEFEHVRPLTRMFRGRNDYPGQPELQCAILGPEFG